MDHRNSQRHPLAMLAGRCGPVMTDKSTTVMPGFMPGIHALLGQ
jgi:hypothetical protein